MLLCSNRNPTYRLHHGLYLVTLWRALQMGRDPKEEPSRQYWQYLHIYYSQAQLHHRPALLSITT